VLRNRHRRILRHPLHPVPPNGDVAKRYSSELICAFMVGAARSTSSTEELDTFALQGADDAGELWG
jgi:hypothetical protein